jgi:hypothetical protein
LAVFAAVTVVSAAAAGAAAEISGGIKYGKCTVEDGGVGSVEEESRRWARGKIFSAKVT